MPLILCCKKEGCTFKTSNKYLFLKHREMCTGFKPLVSGPKPKTKLVSGLIPSGVTNSRSVSSGSAGGNPIALPDDLATLKKVYAPKGKYHPHPHTAQKYRHTTPVEHTKFEIMCKQRVRISPELFRFEQSSPRTILDLPTERVMGNTAISKALLLFNSGDDWSWQHFTQDVLHLLTPEVLKLLRGDASIKILILRTSAHAKFYFREVFHLKNEIVEIQQYPRGVSCVTLFFPVLHPTGIFTQFMVPDQFRQHIRDSIVKSLGLTLKGSKRSLVYLSRVSAPSRKVRNETQVVEALKNYADANGLEYITFDASKYNFRERFQILHNADIVVAPHGGAVYNIYGCRPGTRIIEFIGTKGNPTCWMWPLAKSLGMKYYALPLPFTHYQSLYEVPVRKLQRLLYHSLKKVISFSVYGDKPRYTDGILHNLDMAKKYYPDWICRYYVASDVPRKFVGALSGYDNVEVVELPAKGPMMMWRFMAWDDPSVDVVLVRDIDSRLSDKEAKAVDEWLYDTRYSAHCMHDATNHTHPILGGAFGLRLTPEFRQKLPKITEYINQISQNTYFQDMDYLLNQIYPIIKNDTLNHYHYNQNKIAGYDNRPFPEHTYNPQETLFIGQIWFGGKPDHNNEYADRNIKYGE
uniref:Glycosyltransferase 61 catalytic domain-containing protein n=1 Tax=viral metagenome TaxID=1070528 RepID=A0A6C0CKC5_9ZZZZ